MAQSGLEALELLRSRFFNRTDVVAIQTSAGKPCPARPHDFLRALRGHMRGPRSDTSSFILYAGRGVCTVTGAYRLGTYASDASGRTRWACVDIDGANHKKCVSRPFTLAREVCDALETIGLIGHIERSGSGHGAHVWVFFDQPELLSDVRREISRVISVRAYKHNSTDNAVVTDCVELFPKSDRIRKDGLGSMVWLPWCGHTPQGHNSFLDRENPESLTVCSCRDFYRSTLRTEIKHDGLCSPAMSDNSRRRKHDSMAEWRECALSRLDLGKVYGDILVERESSCGYLRARDANSVTNDRHPSAIVSTGENGQERGRITSFIAGESMSIFDYLMRTRGYSFGRALREIATLSGVPLPIQD